MKTLVKFMDNEDLVVSRHTPLVWKPFQAIFKCFLGGLSFLHLGWGGVGGGGGCKK